MYNFKRLHIYSIVYSLIYLFSGSTRVKLIVIRLGSVWTATSFNPIFTNDGKQSVLIKNRINPQSNSFSVKQPFIRKARAPDWIVPSVRHTASKKEGRRTG